MKPAQNATVGDPVGLAQVMGSPVRALLRTCTRVVRQGSRRLALSLGLGVAAALVQGVSIGLLLPALEVIQRGVPSVGSAWRIIHSVYGAAHVPVTLFTLLLGVFVMILLSQVLLYVQRATTSSLAEECVRAVRRSAFAAFVQADLSFQHSVRTGTLFSGLTQDTVRTGAALETVLDIFTRSALLGIYVAMLLVVSWQATVVALTVTVAASILVQSHMKISRRLGTQFLQLHNQMYGFIQERMAALRLMKVVNAEGDDRQRFDDLIGTVAALRRRVVTRSAQIRLIMEPAVAGAGLAAVFAGLQYFQVGLARLAVFLYVLARILPEAYGLNQARFAAAGMLPSHENIARLVRQAQAFRRVVSGTRICPPVRGAIELQQVTFAYESGPPVLDDVTFTIEAGRLTAIVGPSGAGKSTLLDLIARLIDPTSGRVTFDGVDLREFDLATLRETVGLMSQDVVLFNGTVLDNIRYGRRSATEAEVHEAAVLANADHFIRRLPDGYHTVLGVMGMTLSGGERQRIALARVLLRKPSALLLDEVSSGLDAESERLIQESVFRAAAERTVVLVTHRLTTIERADKIVVIDRGRVVEEGAPLTLLGTQGLFRRLLELQLGFRPAERPGDVSAVEGLQSRPSSR